MSTSETSVRSVSRWQYGFYGALLCLALLMLLNAEMRSRRSSSEVSPIGFRVPRLRPPYEWSQQNLTAIIAIRHGCHFCEDSEPFYQRLFSMQLQGKIGARVILVMPDSEIVGKADVPESAPANQLFYDTPLTSFGVRGTPTILLVDNNHRVVRAWQGELTSREESRLISALR